MNDRKQGIIRTFSSVNANHEQLIDIAPFVTEPSKVSASVTYTVPINNVFVKVSTTIERPCYVEEEKVVTELIQKEAISINMKLLADSIAALQNVFK